MKVGLLDYPDPPERCSGTVRDQPCIGGKDHPGGCYVPADDPHETKARAAEQRGDWCTAASYWSIAAIDHWLDGYEIEARSCDQAAERCRRKAAEAAEHDGQGAAGGTHA